MSTRKQTRFALVLNGGVSLAVWMGGVTHEVNRLRLASSGEPARPTDEKEAAVHDAWAAILEATMRTAVVDILAGTSAGGLNGTLLAKAVAGGKDLPYMRATWSSVAALEPNKLLGQATDERRSLLDGEFFRSQVHELLTNLDRAKEVAAPRDCTLLVTATAIDAHPTQVDLEGVAKTSMIDSRRVYRFERRTDDAGQVDDDFAASVPTMTCAARASASFPLAFEPVWETDDLKSHRVGSADPSNSWLIDGGVLDNAPFGPLLESLQARPVGANFERVVLYVTPSPGGAVAEPLGEDPTATAVMGRVFGAAREPDQRLDVETLEESFKQMGFTLSAPHEPLRRLLMDSSPDLSPSSALDAAALWFPTYRRTRAEAVERWLAGLETRPRLAIPNPPELHPDQICTVPALLPVGAMGWQWGLATAERSVRWWGRVLVDLCDGGVSVPPDTFDQVENAQRMVARLWRALDVHMGARKPSESVSAGADRLARFYETMGKSREIRATLDETAAGMAALSRSSTMDGPAFLQLTLAIEVVSSVLAWGWTSEGDAPKFRYGQITPAAKSIVDIGEVAASKQWPARKLYGERWGHFGAFASQPGRDADWLWGRLDGASALCDYLMQASDGTPLLAPDDIERLTANLVDAILQAEDSTRARVAAAARVALETEAKSLLLHMREHDRAVALQVLWSQVRKLIEAAGGDGARKDGLSAPLMARALLDPTWTKHDRPSDLGWMDRVKLRGLRIYGWPARYFGKKKAKEALRL